MDRDGELSYRYFSIDNDVKKSRSSYWFEIISSSLLLCIGIFVFLFIVISSWNNLLSNIISEPIVYIFAFPSLFFFLGVCVLYFINNFPYRPSFIKLTNKEISFRPNWDPGIHYKYPTITYPLTKKLKIDYLEIDGTMRFYQDLQNIKYIDLNKLADDKKTNFVEMHLKNENIKMSHVNDGTIRVIQDHHNTKYLNLNGLAEDKITHLVEMLSKNENIKMSYVNSFLDPDKKKGRIK